MVSLTIIAYLRRRSEIPLHAISMHRAVWRDIAVIFALLSAHFAADNLHRQRGALLLSVFGERHRRH